MAETQNQDWAVDVSPEEMRKGNANNLGGAFRRVKFGDYKWRCTDAETRAKEGAKPHVMLALTWTAVAAYDPANAEHVGDTITALYAGSPQSPKPMHDSRARVLQAIGFKGGTLSKGTFIGREVDASVIWVLGKASIDPDTGEKRAAPVFANITAERPVGTQRPASFDPHRESAKAAKYLEEQYGSDDDDDDDDGGTASPAWEQPASSNGAQAQAPAPVTPSWRPEAEADPTVHTYRAYVKLKTQHEEVARATLVQAGFDPDGPINADMLGADVKAQYLAAFPPAAAAGGLPPLPGMGAAPAPRTGKRSKSA